MHGTGSRWLKGIFSLILVCLFAKTTAQTDRLFFHHLTTADGLSQSINTFIHKDKQGFVWIGSYDGLNRFDGQQVVVYRPVATKPDAMSGSQIISPFFEDNDGNLWFSTDRAVNCYRHATDDIVHFQITNGEHRLFHREPAGRLWVQVNDTLFVFAPNILYPKSETPIDMLGPLPGNRFAVLTGHDGAVRKILRIAEDDSDSDGYGLGVYGVADGKIQLESTFFENPQVIKIEGVPTRLGRQTIFAVQPTGKENQIWLAATESLMQFDLEKQLITYRHKMPPQQDLWDMAKLDDGRFVFATKMGVQVFNWRNRRVQFWYKNDPADPNSLVDNQSQQVYLDRDKVLWVSGMAKGVDYASLKKVKFDFLPDDRFDNGKKEDENSFGAGAIAEIKGVQTLLFGSTRSAPLRQSDLRGQRIQKWPAAPPCKAMLVRSLDNGDLLISSIRQGAFWYDAKRKAHLKIPSAQNSPVLLDFCQMGKNEVWAGCGGGICQLSKNEKEIRAQLLTLSSVPPGTTVNRIFRDSFDQIYAGCNGNALKVFRMYAKKDSLIHWIPITGDIKSFCETHRYVWVGTDFGLLRINKSKPSEVRLFDESKGLPNNTVYGILHNAPEHLWLSTNAGLVRHHIADSSFRVFTLADGLQDFEFNTNSFLAASDGRFWFGGIRGFNIFHPDSVQDISTPPNVVITEIRINDTLWHPPYNISLRDTFYFGKEERTLFFRFVGLEYSDPDNISLQYRLIYADSTQGVYDKDWITAPKGQGFTRYAQLPAGHFILQITAANSDEFGNGDIRQIHIIIQPRFNETWMYIALLILGIAAGVGIPSWLYYFNRIQRQKLTLREQRIKIDNQNLEIENQQLELRTQRLEIEKRDAVEAERSRIADDMHDDLSGDLNSIRMLSEQLTKRMDNPALYDQTAEITGFAREAVQKMADIIWAMNDRYNTLDNLVAYIRRHAEKFLRLHGLQCSVQPDEIASVTLNGERRRNLLFAVKTCLDNIVKHAEAEQVNIIFDVTDHQLEIRVQDDGKGFDTQGGKRFSNGLLNMNKRLKAIGGTVAFISAPGEGTTVTFRVPFEKT